MEEKDFWNVRYPFTSARVTRTPPHIKLSLWERHALAGTLVFIDEASLDMILSAITKPEVK